MNYTVITDIFGNKLSNNSENRENYNMLPFILIHSNQPHLVLEKIEALNDSIWQLSNSTIIHILYAHGLNSNNFAPVGHIWLPKEDLPKKVMILLVNTDPDISQFPTNFINVGNYGKYNIWKPIGKIGYKGLGYVASIEKPNIKMLKIVNNNFLTSFKGTQLYNNESNCINMNEFNLLSYKNQKFLTIKRSILIGKDNNIKLYSKPKRKYITNTNNNLTLKPNIDDKINNNGTETQNINYSTQGELKMNGKCLGISSFDEDISNNYVYVEDCNNSNKQKWYPYRDNIINQFNQSCLTTSENNSTVETQNCDFLNDYQKWYIEDKENVLEDKLQETNDNWITQKGKKVILIEPDNPWYINKNGKKPEGIIRQKLSKLNLTDYKNTANFHSTFMMDTHKPHMGYGHSYEQRKGRPCLCLEDCHISKKESGFPTLENFNSDNQDNQDNKYLSIDFNTIAYFLVICVILLVSIRIYYNNFK